jgi:hypothetical protein
MSFGPLQLATHSSRNSQTRVNIGEETAWVLLYLLDVEAIAGVDTVRHDASLEGALNAAKRFAVPVLGTDGVWESNAASLISAVCFRD